MIPPMISAISAASTAPSTTPNQGLQPMRSVDSVIAYAPMPKYATWPRLSCPA